MNIGVFLFEGCEELDFAGPWEVLSFWSQLWPDDDVSVFTLSSDGEPVRCAKGLRVIPDHSWADSPAIDVLVYPGGIGTRAQLEDDEVLGWVRQTAQSASVMTSVCTGSLVYAAAGLLDGRPATTHWGSLDHLRSLGNDITVRTQARYVDDGDVVTAAGVSAGIDMALHLIARLHSKERSVEVRRGIQYDPEPPY